MANNTEKLNTLVGKNVKYYRKNAGLTQLKLSIITEISKDYISEIERGKTLPSLKRLEIIANALNIEPYKLLKPHVEFQNK